MEIFVAFFLWTITIMVIVILAIWAVVYLTRKREIDNKFYRDYKKSIDSMLKQRKE